MTDKINDKNIIFIFIAPISYTVAHGGFYISVHYPSRNTIHQSKAQFLHYYSLFFASLILQHTWSKESQPCKLFATILSNDDLKLQYLQEQINNKN